MFLLYLIRELDPPKIDSRWSDLFAETGDTRGYESRCIYANLTWKRNKFNPRLVSSRCYRIRCLSVDGVKDDQKIIPNIDFFDLNSVHNAKKQYYTGKTMNHVSSARKSNIFRAEDYWKAVEIFVPLEDGSLKKVTCSLSDEARIKSVTAEDPGSIFCPNILQVCWGKPCTNRGIPKHQMCVCVPGFFGKFCEYQDTLENRLIYPNRFHFGSYTGILLERSVKVEFQAVHSGPQDTIFEAITPLPNGLYLDKNQGMLSGTPLSTFDCSIFVFEVRMTRFPFAAERTMLKIQVVNDFIEYFATQKGKIATACSQMINEMTKPLVLGKKSWDDINQFEAFGTVSLSHVTTSTTTVRNSEINLF